MIILFLLIPIGASFAQSYQLLADSALHTMWKAKDTADQRKALLLYEAAFKQYPKEVNGLGLYKASVLSGNLMELDKAFGYLNSMLAQSMNDFTWFDVIIGKYATGEYPNLLKEPRWEVVTKRADAIKLAFYKHLADNAEDFKKGGLATMSFDPNADGKTVYQRIKKFNRFAVKQYQNYNVPFKVTDSLSTSYFVSLPKNYNPRNKYSILFFLHGAVQSNGFAEFQFDDIMGNWNRFYTKYAAKNDVIMVYIKGSKKYNWMSPDDGFFIVPAVLKAIKKSINVDDNKVFITGHSNGATGSFSYLMKQQSPFAGFYGFNTQPKVRTGGTFLRNISNRSYFNVSTDQDYYFPPDANDTLNVVMKGLNADYQDHRYNGFPHWFPQFDESEPVYPTLFSDLNSRTRNPFHHEIYWECDNVKYGQADWIQINELDTSAAPANWHKQINFNIHKLLSYDKKNNLIAKDTLLKAFSFPRKSGVVKGYYNKNEFHLQTSAVGKLTVFISPEMIDVTKPVVVFVNGIKKATKKTTYDKQFIIDHFNNTFDRKAIWIDSIEINIQRD